MWKELGMPWQGPDSWRTSTARNTKYFRIALWAIVDYFSAADLKPYFKVRTE